MAADFTMPQQIGEYRVSRMIGESSSHASVWRATDGRGDTVAIKAFHEPLKPHECAVRPYVERECQLMKDAPTTTHRLARHAFVFEHKQYIVMRLIDGLTLRAHCDEHFLGMNARLALFSKLVHKVLELHKLQIIHVDIKPPNVLVERKGIEWDPVIIDYGIAKRRHSATTHPSEDENPYDFTGSLRYMAKKLICGVPAIRPYASSLAPADEHTDIHSLGVVLLELLTGASLYDEPAAASFSARLRAAQEFWERPMHPLASERARGTTHQPRLHRDNDGQLLEWQKVIEALCTWLDPIILYATFDREINLYKDCLSFAGDIELAISNIYNNVAKTDKALNAFAWYHRRVRQKEDPRMRAHVQPSPRSVGQWAGDAFKNTIKNLQELFEQYKEPWHHVQLFDDSDYEELREVIRWMYVEVGRAQAKDKIPINRAIQIAEARIKRTVEEYCECAARWQRYEPFTVIRAVSHDGRPLGMSIVLPVKDKAYAEIKSGQRPTYSCTHEDLDGTSPNIVVEGCALCPIEYRWKAPKPTDGLLASIMCQQAYLSDVTGIGKDPALRVLAFEGTKQNTQRMKWAGYKPTRTYMKSIGVQLWEMEFSVTKAPLFKTPFYWVIQAKWQHLQEQLAKRWPHRRH